MERNRRHEMRRCAGKGRPCGKFMSPVGADPHSACIYCRGQQCSREAPCEKCSTRPPSQWGKYERIRKKKTEVIRFRLTSLKKTAPVSREPSPLLLSSPPPLPQQTQSPLPVNSGKDIFPPSVPTSEKKLGRVWQLLRQLLKEEFGDSDSESGAPSGSTGKRRKGPKSPGYRPSSHGASQQQPIGDQKRPGEERSLRSHGRARRRSPLTEGNLSSRPPSVCRERRKRNRPEPPAPAPSRRRLALRRNRSYVYDTVCLDGETSKDSTSSNDAPTSKTSGKENVTTISNQDKKDNKGNSSSTANPRLILPKVSLILVPCPTEVTKDSEVQPVLKLPAQETQSESQEPPKASESQDISNSQGPPNVSESQVLHDISDSQELLDISNNHVPPSVSETQVLHNVSESQGSPGVSESQPVVQNAVKQQNGTDNLTEILPMATSTPPLRNAPVKGKDSASESMKLSEIKEELLDFSDMCTDQDIPTEEGSLSPVHHRPLKTQENLETSENDPLQLEFLPTDSNDATAPVTDNSQPCGTDTPEKKKVRHTTNKRKRTDTPSKRKRRNERLDESEEHTGSNDAYIQTGKDDRMEENSCETFGKFIAIQLRQLPLKNALNLQMEIHNLIAQERLKVLQEEMKKPVRAVNKKPRDDTSVQKSSANRAAKNKPTYREETTVKTTTVNEEPKKKLRPVRKAASVIKHSKDSIQKEVPKKRTIRSRVSGSFVESSPVMPDAIVPQPSAIYTFGNESLLNISTKSEDYDDDDSYWDAPSPISVKSEAESISSL